MSLPLHVRRLCCDLEGLPRVGVVDLWCTRYNVLGETVAEPILTPSSSHGPLC